MRRRLACPLAAVALLWGCGAGGHSALDGGVAASSRSAPRVASAASSVTSHYEYVVIDHEIDVYDIDHQQHLVQRLLIPSLESIRGVAADIQTHTLYVSHGGIGGPSGDGSLLNYDLLANRVRWDRHYRRGVDSFAISRNGSRIYMPDGEFSTDGIWSVIAANSGRVIARIKGGSGPHNTIVGLSGRRVYLGSRHYRYLDVASTASNRVLGHIGPLRSGVRPFTINGLGTLAYTTATGFLGFQVSSIVTGKVRYTEGFGSRFRWDPSSFQLTSPSHGISLSPNERQLWVLDSPNAYVHVFAVQGVPRRPPRRIADIKLSHSFTGEQSSCSFDCEREGWLQHTLSGCLVYVGDTGDVLSTTTFQRVGYVPALRNSRVFLEIDWRGGRPVATSTRTGLGYVTATHRPPTPSCG